MVDVRAQSLRRLIELLEDAKRVYVETFGEYDIKDFLDYLQEPNYALDYERVAKKLHVSPRTAYDYTEAIREISRILLDSDI